MNQTSHENTFSIIYNYFPIPKARHDPNDVLNPQVQQMYTSSYFRGLL